MHVNRRLLIPGKNHSFTMENFTSKKCIIMEKEFKQINICVIYIYMCMLYVFICFNRKILRNGKDQVNSCKIPKLPFKCSNI
jgi:hypothetical protein